MEKFQARREIHVQRFQVFDEVPSDGIDGAQHLHHERFSTVAGRGVATIRLPRKSIVSDAIKYGDVEYAGPAGIYRSATRQPVVSLATFSTRFRRLVRCNALTDANIEESLWLSANDFRLKYGTRRTLVQVDGLPTDLLAFYAAKQIEAVVDYRNFWQRARALIKRGNISGDTLSHALTWPTADWISFYGGGRRKGLVYEGEDYPEYAGRYFHSVAAFLRTTGRYDDRALTWSRLKAGWKLGDALAVLVACVSHRAGSIYRICQRRTRAVYVGLTLTSVEQRWTFHVRSATAGSTTKLHAAIRADGPDGFDVDVLENGIKDPALLSAREAFWVESLGALGPNGLNSAKPGGLGGPRGKSISLGEETFRSIEEAAEVLAERLGIARHVIRTRLQKRLPLPQADQVRRHSNHPDAGSNLFRRWLGMLKRHARAVADEWMTDYDRFKADVSPVPAGMELVRKRPSERWDRGNVEWVSVQAKVERTHGKVIMVNGVEYPSLSIVAKAHGIGLSTFKNRINNQGMSVEQAIAAPLGRTSYKLIGTPIVVDGQVFRSKRMAILYIAESRNITKHQAKYLFSTGTYWA